MSSTTVSKASNHAEAAGPGSGIYLAFIPWIVFTLVAQHSTLKLAAVGALLASVLIAARSARAGGPKVLELGAVLAFVGFTVVAFIADPATAAFVDRYARAIAAGAAVVDRVRVTAGDAVHRAVRARVGPAAAVVITTVQADQPAADDDVGTGVRRDGPRARDRRSPRHPPRQPDLQLGDPDRARHLGRQAHHRGHRQRRNTTTLRLRYGNGNRAVLRRNT